MTATRSKIRSAAMIEAFCLDYLKTGEAGPAYRSSGFAAPETKDKSCHEQGCRILKDKRVQGRLAELRQTMAGATSINLQSHLADLMWLRERAAADGKWAAAIQAERIRGMAAGLHIERVAMTADMNVTETRPDLSKLSSDELRDLYSMLLKTGVDVKALQ